MTSDEDKKKKQIQSFKKDWFVVSRLSVHHRHCHCLMRGRGPHSTHINYKYENPTNKKTQTQNILDYNRKELFYVIMLILVLSNPFLYSLCPIAQIMELKEWDCLV